MKQYAKIKTTWKKIPSYLSSDAEYEVVKRDGDFPNSFWISDNDGELCYCRMYRCAHIGYGDWEIFEK